MKTRSREIESSIKICLYIGNVIKTIMRLTSLKKLKHSSGTEVKHIFFCLFLIIKIFSQIKMNIKVIFAKTCLAKLYCGEEFFHFNSKTCFF